MQAGVELAGQQLIHAALPRDPALAGEGRRHDRHAIMGFAIFACTCMTGVQMRFVDDLEMLRRQGGGEAALDAFGTGHGVIRLRRLQLA